MPTYRYRAVDFTGRIAQGNVTATNEWELAQNLSQSGLELIAARTKNRAAKAQTRFMQRLAPRALTQFASQMTQLLQAGIPFAEALRDTGQAATSPALRDAADDIHRAVNHGSTIANAFARHPRLFPDVFTAILAAGEKSGDLVATFDHLTRYAEARARTIEQLRKAIRYPLFLLFVTGSVIGFMSTMVIPQIMQFLNTIDGQLPLMTRILIATSDAIANFWWVGLLVVALAVCALHTAHKYSESAARALDAFVLRLPLMGPIVRKLALTRFAHSFSILFHSGIGIIESMRGAGVTLGNRALAAALENATQNVQTGRPLSVAMVDLFPPFALHMMRIGERSGKLGKALDDVANACDREVADVTGKLIGAMEPILTLAVGGILAWIVMAVMGPIYGSVAKIGATM